MILGEFLSYFLLIIQCDFFKGDGGEDVSCVLEDWHVEPSDQDHEGHFDQAYVDGFLGDLKMFLIGGLVNPRTKMGQRFVYIIYIYSII